MIGDWQVTRMSGAGNDFLVLGPEEARRMAGNEEAWARRACRRGISAGADGVLLVEPDSGDRVRVRFFNPDGSAAFCGNGSRCAARFAFERGWAPRQMVLVTDVGEVPARVERGEVSLVLSAPRDLGPLEVELGGRKTAGRHVEAGCPHWVGRVDDVRTVPLSDWGPRLRRDPRLGPGGANIDLIGPSPDGTSLDLRTWERGVEGETLACGSGAVAAAFAWRLDGGPRRVRVVPQSRIPLTVELPGSPDNPEHAVLSGEARFVLEGRLGPEAFHDAD